MLSLPRTQECLCAIKTMCLMLSLFIWLLVLQNREDADCGQQPEGTVCHVMYGLRKRGLLQGG